MDSYSRNIRAKIFINLKYIQKDRKSDSLIGIYRVTYNYSSSEIRDQKENR